MAKLNATRNRWVSELADFNITLKYCPGKANVDADFLSRTPVDTNSYISECIEQCSPEALSVIFSTAETQKKKMDWISTITCSPHVQELAAVHQPDVKVTQQELLQAVTRLCLSCVLQLKASSERQGRGVTNMETAKTKRLLHESKRLCHKRVNCSVKH